MTYDAFGYLLAGATIGLGSGLAPGPLLTGRFPSFPSSRAYTLLMRFLGMILVCFALILFRDGLRFLGIWG